MDGGVRIHIRNRMVSLREIERGANSKVKVNHSMNVIEAENR